MNLMYKEYKVKEYDTETKEQLNFRLNNFGRFLR